MKKVRDNPKAPYCVLSNYKYIPDDEYEENYEGDDLHTYFETKTFVNEIFKKCFNHSIHFYNCHVEEEVPRMYDTDEGNCK